MKRRIFILLVLVGFLSVLMPKQSVLALCNCYDPYSQCLSEAVTNYENCTFGAQNAFDQCMSNNGLHSICDPPYQNSLAQCEVTFTNAEYSCDQSLNSCLSGCGQSGGGSSGTVCNEDEQMGYSVDYVPMFTESLDACISDGGSAFTAFGWSRDYFDLCMTNTNGNNQELCCREQIKNLLDTYATCNISQHHPLGCKHCVTF